MLQTVLLLTLLKQSSPVSNPWGKVWHAIRQPVAKESISDNLQILKRPGAPERFGKNIVFRFLAPKGTKVVYLAGSFNGFAENSNGHVTNSRYAMHQAAGSLWWAILPLSKGVIRYKYVFENGSGSQSWVADPCVSTKDGDGNTSFDLSMNAVQPPLDQGLTWPKPVKPTPIPLRIGSGDMTLHVQKVWTKPSEPNDILVDLVTLPLGDSSFKVDVSGPFGQAPVTLVAKAHKGENRLTLPVLGKAGGYLVKVALQSEGRTVSAADTVLTVADSLAEDIRYGFFSTYAGHDGDYNAKAGMLADVGVNAVEYYDYFPAHGVYAPTQASYVTEPFGIKIDALDIQAKIRASHGRNIASLAYVAAYAASESVYRSHQDPMTDDRGVAKIFNGSIMPEDQADREHEPKWFWLMDIADGSPWHSYILSQFSSALEVKPGNLLSFDGFEVDTYGDSSDTKFFAKGSKRNGEPLRDVLHDFVGEIRAMTHSQKPNGLVSFNSVNEFAADEMADSTDFLFLEIWHGHTDQLEGLTEIAFNRRSAFNKRVVLKVYPADMQPKQKSYSPASLRRLLAAAIAGGGTLMVAGEPDERGGHMHALQSLYYPDHQSLSAESTQVLRDYNRQDAMLFGYSHGHDVTNFEASCSIKGCYVRGFASPSNRTLTYQIVRTGGEDRWSVEPPNTRPEQNLEAIIDLPAGVTPKTVWYSSPDNNGLQTPIRLESQIVAGKMRLFLPELNVLGTIVLQY